MVNVRKIAKEANVSISTVSRVLNSKESVDPELRQRVLRIANEYRYVASGGKRDLMNLALVYLGDVRAGGLLTSPFDIALLQGMATQMGDKQFTLSILDGSEAKYKDETYTQMFHRRGIRGAVLRAIDSAREDCVAIAEEGFPAIVVAERFDNKSVSWLDGNSRGASEEGMRKLVEHGHRKIAICQIDKPDQDHLDRFDAYQAIHQEAGLEVNPEFNFSGGANRELGSDTLRKMMAMEDRPTAVFVTDPLVAVGMLREAQRMKIRIPEQLSVLGFDDSNLRFDTVPVLTAICQDTNQIGVKAIETIIEMVHTEGCPAFQVESPVWLDMQESIGPVPTK